MSFKKLFIMAAIALAAVACEDEEDTTTTPSLDGALTFSVPEYVAQLQTVTMTPKGVEHPDGKVIGYYWKVIPTMTVADTTRYSNGLDSNSADGKPSDGSFTHTFSDTLQTYKVYANAYASGYATSTASRDVKVVKGGLNGSIKNTGIFSFDAKVSADGMDYYYVRIGDLDWMRNNLSNPASGIPYRNAEVMSDVFGRYYSYDEAMTACPEGWRLPTDAEWVAMASNFTSDSASSAYNPISGVAASLMANATFNGLEMWEYVPTVGDITNSSRLSFLPVGYADKGSQDENGGYPGASFMGLNEYSVFWTADVVADESDMAYCRYLVCDQSALFTSKASRSSFGASVRCVRQAQ